MNTRIKRPKEVISKLNAEKYGKLISCIGHILQTKGKLTRY
jgi:hypothetical protein